MNNLAIFGNVLTKDELSKWIDTLVEDAVRSGEMAPDEAPKFREQLHASQKGVVPLYVCTDTNCDDPLTVDRFVQKEWNGQYTEHRWQVDPTNQLTLPFSHIVLFEGPKKEGVVTPFYFNGKPIMGPFGICIYDEKQNAYRHIHCGNCAETIVRWITEKQQTWMRAQGDAEAPKAATHEAPKRLQ